MLIPVSVFQEDVIAGSSYLSILEVRPIAVAQSRAWGFPLLVETSSHAYVTNLTPACFPIQRTSFRSACLLDQKERHMLWYGLGRPVITSE